MKTKITTLLMAIAFLVTSVAFADGQPKSSATNPNKVYLGPPIEVPRSADRSIEVRIAMFLADFFSRSDDHELVDTGKIDFPYDPTQKGLNPADPITD